MQYSSGSQTRGRDPFEGRQTSKKGHQILKLWIFSHVAQN